MQILHMSRSYCRTRLLSPRRKASVFGKARQQASNVPREKFLNFEFQTTFPLVDHLLVQMIQTRRRALTSNSLANQGALDIPASTYKWHTERITHPNASSETSVKFTLS
jgi:hypothetical protein